jgi:hypothetical protein
MADTKKITNTDLNEERKNLTVTLSNRLSKEKKVQVLGNEGLVPFLGSVFTIHVNGMTVSLPLDGKYHEFPASVAELLQKKLSKISKANLAINKTNQLY